MSDPRTPRPSDGWNAAHGPQPRDPGQPGRTPPPIDPLESLLEGYARSTDVAPASDLSRRIHAAIGREPARTPPRRFLVALVGLRLTVARDAFAQSAGVALGRGRFPALVRAQALALVILTLGVVSAGVIGGAVGLRGIVDGFDPDDRAPVQLVASPSPSASSSPSVSPSATPSPSPSAVPSPSPEPTREAADDPTAEPTEDGIVQVRRTQPPDAGTKVTPRATQKPRATAKPTPKATREPRETEKPRKTPKPTRKPTPEPEETDEPAETDEPDQTDEPDDDNGGGNSGPGSAGLAGSGAVVAVGPVLLVITI